MQREVSIGGRAVQMKVTARTPFLYREAFGADLMADMLAVAQGVSDSDTADIVARFAWLCARDGGEAVFAELPPQAAVDAWLESMDDLWAIYDALPQVLALWRRETDTASIAKKNDLQP